MTNKELLEDQIKGRGYKLGLYNPIVDKLPKVELDKVFDDMWWGDTAIEVSLDKKEYIVEVAYLGDEINIGIVLERDYLSQYSKKVGGELYKSELKTLISN